jgi:hypothetical protein
MLLSFDRGDASRPRGHALLYFKSWSDASALFATYLIVPPIAVEISKYIPPMFAAQFQGLGASGGIAVFPYPPIPERVESQELLTRLAQARDDDLVSGGSVDTTSPERLLQASAEAAQQYFESFSSYMASIPSGPQPEALPESSVSVDVNELMFGLMSERERLAELTKLSGQLRYAVGGGDEHLAKATESDIKKLGSYLPEKYRAGDIATAARRPGPDGDRLTQLYIERAYKLADEDYESVSKLEAEIREFEAKSS